MWLLLVTLMVPFVQAATHTQTLAQKGYESGLLSQEQQSKSSYYVRLPPRSMVKSADLTIEVESSPLLKSPSNLKVFFEGRPLGNIDLSQVKGSTLQQQKVRFPIPLETISGKFGRVDLEFINVISGDRCLDQKMNAGMVRVTENSAFTIISSDEINSVSSFFETLPPVLPVLVGQAAGPETLKLLFQLDAVASHFGSKLTLTTNSDEALIMVVDDGPTEVKKIDGRSRLTISPKNEFVAAPFLSDMEGLFTEKTLPSLSLSSEGAGNTLTRDELRLSPAGDATINGRVWSVNLPRLSGTSRVPSKLHLSLTSSRSFGKIPASLYVYLADDLLRVIPLVDTDGPQYHQVLLPEKITEWPAALRLQLRRNDLIGKCGEDFGRDFDIRLLEDTAVEYQDQSEPSQDFVGFAKSDSDYEVIVPGNLNHLKGWLSQLSWVRKTFDLNVDRGSFITKAAGAPRKILLAEAAAFTPAEIRFLGTQRLSVKNLSGVTLMSSSHKEKAHWLSVTSFGAPTVTRAEFFSPDHHDFLLLGRDRIEVLALSGELEKRIGKHTQGPNLISFFEEWRYLLMGIAWVVLTVVFLVLGKKFR